MNRRTFVRGAAVLPLAAGMERFLSAETARAGTVMFAGVQTVGNDNKGIRAYRWDAATGTLSSPVLAAESDNPTYLTLSPDRRYLFAANELDSFRGMKTGGVSSFRIEGKPGELAPINAVASAGAGTCFVGVDPSGRVLLCANYTGGSAASFRIGAGGALSHAVSEFHYEGHGPNKDRQEAPHVHRAITSPSGKYAFFNDLGLDVIHIYKLDAATAILMPSSPAAWQAPAGAGPRALRFHPDGKWAYCVLEMGAAVALLGWDEATGTLTTKQIIKLTPDGFTGRAQASEIAFDRAGRFAYVACRYYDTLVSFSVEPGTGQLTMLGRSTCGGKVPRDITLDPTERWMLVANQDSDGIAVVARDPKSGRLADTAAVVPLVKPQCLVFV